MRMLSLRMAAIHLKTRLACDFRTECAHLGFEAHICIIPIYFSGLRLRKSTGNQKFFWSCWMHAQSSSPIMIATVPPHFCRRNKPSKCLEGSHFPQNFSRKRKNTAPKFTIDYRYQTWGTASMLNFRAVHNKNSVEWNDHNHVIKKLKLLGLDWLSNSFRYNFPQFIRAQSGLNTNVVSERKTWTTTVGLEWPRANPDSSYLENLCQPSAFKEIWGKSRHFMTVIWSQTWSHRSSVASFEIGFGFQKDQNFAESNSWPKMSQNLSF